MTGRLRNTYMKMYAYKMTTILTRHARHDTLYRSTLNVNIAPTAARNQRTEFETPTVVVVCTDHIER